MASVVPVNIVECFEAENKQMAEACSHIVDMDEPMIVCDDDVSENYTVEIDEPMVISDDEDSEIEKEKMEFWNDIGYGTGTRENPNVIDNTEDDEDYTMDFSTLSEGDDDVIMDIDNGDLFMDSILPYTYIDEVEKETVKQRVNIEESIKSIYIELFIEKCYEMVKQNCYGCEFNSSSQIDHDLCCMSTEREILEKFYEHILYNRQLLQDKFVFATWAIRYPNLSFDNDFCRVLVFNDTLKMIRGNLNLYDSILKTMCT